MPSISAFLRNIYDRIEWMFAFKTALAASLSLIAGLQVSYYLHRPDTIVSGLWSVLSSIVVSQSHLGGTYKAALIRFFGVFIGSIMGGALTVYLGSDYLSVGLGVFSTIIFCSIFNIKDSFRIACMSFAVVMLLWGFKQNINPWLFSFYRFIDSCIGIFVTILVAHLIFPEKSTTNLKQNISKILNCLVEYYRLFLISATEKDSSDAFQYSNDLFIETQKLLNENHEYLEGTRLEHFNLPNITDQWTLITNQLETLFESIDSLRDFKLYKISKIFDIELEKQLEKVISLTNLTFEELAQIVDNKITTTHTKELNQSLIDLNHQLVRFRSTRATRQFDLDDIESFFVFFYTLRSIGKELIKLEELIIKSSN